MQDPIVGANNALQLWLGFFDILVAYQHDNEENIKDNEQIMPPGQEEEDNEQYMDIDVGVGI